MTGVGYGSIDADGSWGFKATADGKVILGNTSDDVLQITGTVEQEGTSFKISGDDARIKINGDTDSHPGLEFYENGTRKWIIFNNYGDDSLDFKAGAEAQPAMVIDADGKVGIGTDSPDYKLDVAGNIGVDQKIYHNGDADTYINFTEDRIRFNAGGINLFGMHQKASAPHQVTVNNGTNNVDFVVNGDDGSKPAILRSDANNYRVGINTDTPTVDLDVQGTTQSNYYITTPSTQDLGSGTSSTLSIGSSLMFLDAASITGVFDAMMGMDIHTLTLPNGTTSGQRLTLVVEGNMGAANSIPIQIAGNLFGVSDFFMPGAKTSLNFVYYSTASISAWYQV